MLPQPRGGPRFSRLLLGSALVAFLFLCWILSRGAESDLPRVIVNESHRDTLHFAIIGDFGTADDVQMGVAKAFESAVEGVPGGIAFVLSTGDQVYPHGVLTADDPGFDAAFEQVYTSPALRVPWYMNIGNHDCEGNASAQVAYAQRNSRWIMPNDYHAFAYRIGNQRIYFIVLNTCALVCAGQYGELSRCFPNMTEQYAPRERTQQLRWFERTLHAIRADCRTCWIVVAAHWSLLSFLGNGPTRELVESVLPLLRRYRVQVFFSGHDHGLQHLVYPRASVVAAKITQSDGGFVKTTTGDGGVRDGDGGGDARTHFVVSGGGGYKLHRVAASDDVLWVAQKLGVTPSRADGLMPDVRYAQAAHGFVLATLAGPHFDTLALRFVGSDDGTTLYQTRIGQDDGSG